jgi:acyl-CoA synthetase (NDP forming)
MSNFDWKTDLTPLLSPKSIALIGASENSAWSSAIFHNLKELGYKGKLFPVNPKRETAFGLKCYPDVIAIPEAVDAFVIAISRDFIVPVLQVCAQKQIRSGVIISAGFAEASAEGKAIQEEIVKIANEAEIRICGPNSFGVANLHQGVSLISSSEVKYLKPGKISFIFQSGGLLNAALLAAWDRGWRIGYAISCGNEAVLNVADYADYLVRDETTDVIGVLTEGFRDPQKFLSVAKRAAEFEKPIVILKLGRSQKGRLAAQAHTATLVGSDEVYDAIFKQHGLTRVADLDDLIETVELFSKRKKLKGHRVGVIVPSGAECGLVADLANDAGIELAELSSRTVERFAPGQSPYLPVRNPLNAPERYVRRGEVFREWIETLVTDENLDILGLRLPLPRQREDGDVIARFHDLTEIAKRTEKLLVLFSRASISLPEYWRKLLAEHDIPFLLEYRKGFKAVRALIDYNRFLKEDRGHLPYVELKVDREKISDLLASGHSTLTQLQGKEILAEYGIPIARERLVKTEDEALTAAKTIGYPVVLKVESRQIAHKTDARAVKTSIQSETELLHSYREVVSNAKSYNPNATIEGILVQEMIHGGREVIVGMTQDPQFGPVIIFGIGGVFVETIKDVSMRATPVTKTDALEMIGELRANSLLKGVRGESESDIDAVADVLCRFSKLAVDLADEIAEIDINPLMVLEKGKGAVAVDCLMMRKFERR